MIFQVLFGRRLSARKWFALVSTPRQPASHHHAQRHRWGFTGGDPNWVRHKGDGSQHVISLRGLRRRLRLRPGSGYTSHYSLRTRSCSAAWSVQHTAARDISVERRCSRHAPPVRTTRSCLRMHRKRPSQSRWSAARRGAAVRSAWWGVPVDLWCRAHAV